MNDDAAQKISAIVFDWAGVLTEPPMAGLEKYYAELGLPDGVLSAFVRGDSEFSKVERGESTIKEFLKTVCIRVEAKHGVEVNIRLLAAALTASRDLQPSMVELVKELTERYDLAVLTNNVRENQTWLESSLPVENFEFILNSADLGLRKPDPEIYRDLLHRLDRPPSEVVFIDDFAENLPPAAALGINTVEYRGTSALRRSLSSLGVKVRTA